MKDIVLAAAICLGACTTVVPATLLQLQGIDPLTADPADIAVRVDLPDGVCLRPGSGTLDLRAERASGETLSGTFPILMVGDVLQIDPEVHEDLRVLQAKIRAWKDADPDGTQGSLSVDFEPCLEAEPTPARPRISIDLRLSDSGPFLPLVRDAPLDDALEMAALEELTPCP